MDNWKTLSERKPPAPGVYEVKNGKYNTPTNYRWFSYWNGDRFM